MFFILADAQSRLGERLAAKREPCSLRDLWKSHLHQIEVTDHFKNSQSGSNQTGHSEVLYSHSGSLMQARAFPLLYV